MIYTPKNPDKTGIGRSIEAKVKINLKIGNMSISAKATNNKTSVGHTILQFYDDHNYVEQRMKEFSEQNKSILLSKIDASGVYDIDCVDIEFTIVYIH